MELYDASNDTQKKNKKIYIGLTIGIAILIVLVIVIIGLIIYLKTTIWTYELNGEASSNLADIVIIDEKDTSKLYIPIRKISDYVGYESFRGDYINLSEEDSKCYVMTGQEVAMFTEGSDIVERVSQTQDNSKTEYIQIDEPITRKNGELCTTINGIENSLNMVISYNYEKQSLKVYTLEYLYETYKEKVSEYGYTDLSTNFTNEKAILENILVGSNNGLFGAYNLETDSVILENKYDNVVYLPETQSFIVTGTNDKMGVITKDKINRINVEYDNIELITENNNTYYLVTKDEKHGLIDENGQIIIEPIISDEYQKIGIDISDFESNGIKDGYILLNKLIPVQDSNDLWGFVDKTTGELVIECQYESLGCINNDEEKENVLVIESQDVIVVSNGQKYDVITDSGIGIYNMALDSVYMEIDEEKNITYYLTSGKNITDAEENIKMQRQTRNI